MYWWATVLALAAANVSSIAVATDIRGQGSGLSMYKARKLAEVLPYSVARRVQTYQVMRRLGQLNHNPLFSEPIKEIESETFPGMKRLVLIDTDNDAVGDYFVYKADEGPDELYGAMFPLVEGGPPAWIVFPVGPVLDDEKELLFLFLHWVDQNSDGRADLTIFEDVDLDQSGWPESGMSAWLADDDFDGLVDTAMHCAKAECSEIKPVDGVFDLKLRFNPGGGRFVNGQEFANTGFLELLFRDLRLAMEME
ncbi:CREC-EF hand family protein [Ovoidimarina sediminis]|uniref:hypothetical protein n=1 Tax=Ovoidimarina sediminis TaxID=3079856 RepID=UPI00291172D1|nr:hypothetical protein [Rhodophyticola sp. MJ-SS7]MDU8943481.1 hypothetical protein [Rhodophyticola sp. MJ-SS7]